MAPHNVLYFLNSTDCILSTILSIIALCLNFIHYQLKKSNDQSFLSAWLAVSSELVSLALAGWVCFLAMLLEISVEAYRNYTTGQRHAMNFYGLTPRADVVAASEPDAAGCEWAAENLDGVQVYSDYDEMLEKADIQAVVIVSITAVHAEQAIKAIEKGYHVLCEKPLSININIVSTQILMEPIPCFLC